MTAAVEPWHEDCPSSEQIAAGAKEAYDAIIDPASSVLKIKPGRTMTNSKKHLRNWSGDGPLQAHGLGFISAAQMPSASRMITFLVLGLQICVQVMQSACLEFGLAI